METRKQYKERMQKTVLGFSRGGITPQWHPGENDVLGFCHDEVVRQRHDTNLWSDGGVRVAGMVAAWFWTLFTSSTSYPNVQEIKYIGFLIEPDYNRGGFRHENVYVGTRMGVFPPYLDHVMKLLCKRAPEVEPGPADMGYVDTLMIEAFDEQVREIKTVDEWYLAFEWVHPFRDGNGRTGKVLYNWLNRTMTDPVLVRDYFGFANP